MRIQQVGSVQPIIIKRKRVYKSDGHHGGAWKVAYADFVTAMMAFFLLMWLLNATTEEQRKGIADYFSPTIPISRISGGGSDALNGPSIMSEQTYAKMGTGASHEKTVAYPKDSDSDADAHEKQAIAAELETLKQSMKDDGRQLSEHMMIKMSPEGIVLEITDSDEAPLFPVGQSVPSTLLTDMLGLVAGSFRNFENDIKIVGHTDSLSYRNGAAYDNWNLSSDRANAARKLLLNSGMEPARILEVSGKADTDPLIEGDRSAAQNRRISITILTR
ncbi:flagellar motor protein MotB [Hyphomonas johnsonii]|jgi:chemotaxis protein MotB|uniref:Putative chemotaxis MotB protein n=1 Tax=Hyphomonas johnsonii MHS-2 TaxID=1280950 RepID=A0A059FP27_9PROT|nr:flagellar motor protein MotB [Hyphomonas johnsonii]KCZ92218.1 putative chemotaxis MotB protein [Hyphomonas johnsonii MHS-2]